MSNEESQKPDDSESGVVGRSSTSDRMEMVLEEVGGSSMSVETRVDTVNHRPSDDFASLLEIPAVGSNHQEPQASVEHASAFSPSTTGLFIGRLIGDSEEPPAVFLPSATHPYPFEFRGHLPLPHQATDDSDDDDNNDYDYREVVSRRIPEIDLHFCKHSESSCALLISGRDINNIAFTRTCLRDAQAMKDALGGPRGIIPPNNISLITPYKNQTEQQIENIYSHVTMKRPKKLFFYFSGHELSTSTGQARMNVSACQGNALNVSRVKRFIANLPCCYEVFAIIDCCSAAEHLLLPMVPADANVAANRSHIQWCSSKRGGQSYLYAGTNSVFTLCVISAMTCANECPNKDGNCPLCSKLRSVVSHNGHVTSTHLMECVQNHMKLSRHQFSFVDLPQSMVNPVARA